MMFKRIGLGLMIVLTCFNAFGSDYPKDRTVCQPMTVMAFKKLAETGQFGFYDDPRREGQCLLISFQQPWDKSRPAHLQIIPTSLPDFARPFLTQHTLIDTVLPERYQVTVNWLHLGYAEDRLRYREYLSMLAQPALSKRINEVMAYRALAQDWPLSTPLSEAERLAHVDVTVAILLSQTHGSELSDMLAEVRAANMLRHFYHYLDAMRGLREGHARQHFGIVSMTPTQENYLPVRSHVVYERLRIAYERTPTPVVTFFQDAAIEAEKLLNMR